MALKPNGSIMVMTLLQTGPESCNKLAKLPTSALIVKEKKRKKYSDKNTSNRDLEVSDKVLYTETDFVGKKKMFAAKWTGPVTIVKIKGDVVIIKLASGKTKPININHLINFGNKKLLKRGRKQMLKIQTAKKRPRKRTKTKGREKLNKVWHLTP